MAIRKSVVGPDTCPWAKSSGSKAKARSTPLCTRWARHTRFTASAKSLETQPPHPHRPAGATVATIIADSGLRYLSSDVYRTAADDHPAPQA